MAALPLRVAYDCAIIGESWAARLIAQAMSRAGLRAVLVASEPRPVDAWLHPRLRQEAAHDLPRLLPLRGIIVRDVAGECVQVVKPNAPALEVRESSLSTTAHYEGNARFVVQMTGPTHPAWAVGGIYRHVAMSPGEDAFAHLFQTQLPGVVAWLLACGGGLFSLGILRAAVSRGVEGTAQELFEEALVACPALTRRLAQAQLVGGLHSAGNRFSGLESSSIPGAVVLPAFDAAIDPLFASGYEMSQRCAAELADLLSGCLDAPHRASERIADWHRDWRMREHGQQNLVDYYYSCPPPLDIRPGIPQRVRESSHDFA